MTCPASSSSIFGIPATGAVTGVERRGPVDKGGLTPPPAFGQARLQLQRVCYGVAAAFAAAGLVMAFVFDVAVLIPFAIPVTLFFIAGLALGLEKPSLRQRMSMWCVTMTTLTATGITMMPRELGTVMEAVRDGGFILCAAAIVLTGLGAFLPPYGRDRAGKGDRGLRAAALVFCLCATMVSYMGVYFVCTPHGH